MKRERLIKERTKKRKDRAQVAAELSISEVYVRKLESGTVKPGRDLMFRIAAYYNVSERKLFPDIFFAVNDKKLIKTGTE